MSEEQTPTTVVNNELTDRVNKAYIASSFTLLNGGSDNIIMITGEKDGQVVNILVTYEELENTIQGLKNEVAPKTND